MDEDRSPEPDGEGAGWSARNLRLLKFAVYIMGALIVLGTVALVSAIVMKAGRLEEARPRGFGELVVAVPEGATVTRSRLDGDRLAIDISTPQGPEVVIVDVRRGVVLGRVKLKPGAP